MKWLEKNAIEMYSTDNRRKSVVAQILIRTLNLWVYNLNIKKCIY